MLVEHPADRPVPLGDATRQLQLPELPAAGSQPAAVAATGPAHHDPTPPLPIKSAWSDDPHDRALTSTFRPRWGVV